MFRSFKSMTLKRAAVLTTTLLVGMVGAVVLAGPASAHDFEAVGSTTVCDAATGTYTVTYTGAGDFWLNSTVTVLSHSPAASTVTPQSQYVQSVAANDNFTDPFTIVQTGIPGNATSASITIKEVWTDDYVVQKTVSVTNLKGNCTTSTTATAPTFSDDVCTNFTPAGASYTIPTTTGVIYKVNGETVAAGTYPAKDGSTVTVTAQAAEGYTLTGTTTFSHTFGSLPSCTTTTEAASPTFSNDVCTNFTPAGASYTIPTTTGVIYKVNGETVAAGTYPAKDGSTVTVTAEAAEGYTLTGPTSFSHTFTATPACTSAAVVVDPTFTDDVCHDNAATGASYTVPAVTGVTYEVNGSTVAAGTHSATDGSTITITAHAAAGYTLSGASSFTHTFAAAPTCAAAASGLAFTGTSTSVPATIGIAAGLLAVGVLLVIGAGRLGRRNG